MRQSLLIYCLLICFFVVLAASTALGTDNFATGLSLTGGRTTLYTSNFGATREASDPLQIDYYIDYTLTGTSTVWFHWTAPTSEAYSINTIGSSFDTQLYVSIGNAAPGTKIASNEDAPGVITSQVDFNAVKSTTYNIMVAGFDMDGGNGQGNIVLNISPSITAPSGYILRVEYGKGSVSASPPPGPNGRYPTNSVVTLTAIPAAGFTFTGWSGNASGSDNPLDVTMTSNKWINAIFSESGGTGGTTNRYSLVLNSVGGGMITASPEPSPVDGKYASNTVVTLTAVATNGYAFAGWEVPVKSSHGTNGMLHLNVNRTITANFARIRTWPAVSQVAYLKSSNSEEYDWFGTSVAVDGDTLVVSAAGDPGWGDFRVGEDSAAIGVNGDQNNNEAPGSGAVYVFVRNGTNWIQQAYLKASNTDTRDAFGFSVAISGETIVVGAVREDSSATGVNGNQLNNDSPSSGAAYVFVRHGTNWVQQAYLKASNTETNDGFGRAVAISGETIVVGAFNESSASGQIKGDQTNNDLVGAGAAYVFVRQGSNWSQQAYLKAPNPWHAYHFGCSVSISGDSIVVGSFGDKNPNQEVDLDPQINDNHLIGAAHVFLRQGTNWSYQAYLKAFEPVTFGLFGYDVAISGNTIVVGEPGNGRNSTNTTYYNYTANSSGAAYVFVRSGTNWTREAFLKASNIEFLDYFGQSVAIGENSIIIAAPYESSSAREVNGNQTNNSVRSAGAAYVFARRGTNWSQQAYLKAFNNDILQQRLGAEFGHDVALSGRTALISAHFEEGGGVGVNADPWDGSAPYSGAAYVFSGIGPAPPPLISIGQSAESIRLGWPLEGLDFQLYHTSSIDSVTNRWIQFPLPYQTNQSKVFVTVPKTNAMQFFRLKEAE